MQIGAEAGRILQPTAFGLAPNGTFVVADRPGLSERIQVFAAGGSPVGGFTIPGRAQETITLEGVVLNGIGTLHYDGRHVLLSQPETGALVAEYSLWGGVSRTFGDLRRTGHESDRAVHLGLNGGMPAARPRRVLLRLPGRCSGVPQVRRERDARLRAPHRGGRARPGDGRASDRVEAAQGDGRDVDPHHPADRADGRGGPPGRLWVSFVAVPLTYVYDADGEKVRVVRFEGAGTLSPTSLFFSHTGRLLVAPGCYEFAPG